MDPEAQMPQEPAELWEFDSLSESSSSSSSLDSDDDEGSSSSQDETVHSGAGDQIS